MAVRLARPRLRSAGHVTKETGRAKWELFLACFVEHTMDGGEDVIGTPLRPNRFEALGISNDEAGPAELDVLSGTALRGFDG